MLIAVGTDGHRLAACKTDLQVTETACLPADVLSDVCDTLVNTGSTAYITLVTAKLLSKTMSFMR